MQKYARATRSCPGLAALGVAALAAGYIIAIVVTYLVVLSVVSQFYALSPRQIVVFGALLLCGAATVELTKRSGENAGLITDYGVWELPIAILLPLVYAMLVPVFRFGLTQRRVRRSRCTAGSSARRSSGCPTRPRGPVPRADPDWVRVGTQPAGPSDRMGPRHRRAALMQWVINTTLLLPAFRGPTPGSGCATCCSPGRTSITTWLSCVSRFSSPSAWPSALSRIIFALPFVTLLQRSVRHAQLMAASASIPRRACSTPEPGSVRPPPRSHVLYVLVPRWHWS